MHFDFENKVIEDVLMVSLESKKDLNIICSDKVNKVVKKRGQKIIPFVIEDKNKYAGYEKKISHYYKNIDKYCSLGIENVEQFFTLVLLQSNKLVGKDKHYGLMIQEYIKYRDDYMKMGFLTIESFIEYKNIFNKYKDYKRTTKEYSLIKDYEKRKEEIKELGIYSAKDFIYYNELMQEALFVYDKSKIGRFISLDDFLEFELRVFKWRKDYFSKNKSLKGVQAYIDLRYKEDIRTLNIPGYIYFEEPNFYYKSNNKIINFSKHFNRNAELIKLKHKYKSEQIKIKYSEYMKSFMEDLDETKKLL